MMDTYLLYLDDATRHYPHKRNIFASGRTIASYKRYLQQQYPNCRLQFVRSPARAHYIVYSDVHGLSSPDLANKAIQASQFELFLRQHCLTERRWQQPIGYPEQRQDHYEVAYPSVARFRRRAHTSATAAFYEAYRHYQHPKKRWKHASPNNRAVGVRLERRSRRKRKGKGGGGCASCGHRR